MPSVHAVVESPVERTFRVEQASAIFDVPVEQKSREEFCVDVPGIEEDWSVGVIVGPSGSGKSTVVRYAYPDAMVGNYDWHPNRSVLDGFPAGMETKDIVAMLSSVGFSSPPAWVRPYHVLSGGQRMRCDLARMLLLDQPVVVFDEYTSVVDRTVAKVVSACVNKAVRRGQSKCKKFVAVTCHYDVLEWLEPDWVLDMATGKLARGRLQRGEKLRLVVEPCGKELWPAFARHHYLSPVLRNEVKCYAAYVNEEPVGFHATSRIFGQRGMRYAHRTVVQPDYQGFGIGMRLINAATEHECRTMAVRYRFKTSHPSLIWSLNRSPLWLAASAGNQVPLTRTGARKPPRLTVSFEYIGPGSVHQRDRVGPASGAA